MHGERLLRLADVKRETTLSKATIYRLIAQGKFRRGEAMRDMPRVVVWPESAITDFRRSQFADRFGISMGDAEMIG